MTLDARLNHIQLLSPDPGRIATFYESTLGMTIEALDGDTWACRGPARTVLVASGPKHKLGFAAWGFRDAALLARQRKRMEALGPLLPSPSPLFGPEAFAVKDPDGNLFTFGLGRVEDAAAVVQPGDVLPARLQHVVLRTTDPEPMLAFARDVLGFRLSDEVRDEQGGLRACFLRTDAEHHSLAIFRAPEARHDHHSFEAPDWSWMSRWADHMAARGARLVWGIGRHGPGNDVFFMVEDPDGNLTEISSELEVCAEDRATGTWPHAPSTLNRWGVAIMRS
jgi:catechol 2,3-dioxygenase